jgi:hypothetical protein
LAVVATHRASATVASQAALETASSAWWRFSERTYASRPWRPRAMSGQAVVEGDHAAEAFNAAAAQQPREDAALLALVSQAQRFQEHDVRRAVLRFHQRVHEPVEHLLEVIGRRRGPA